MPERHLPSGTADSDWCKDFGAFMRRTCVLRSDGSHRRKTRSHECERCTQVPRGRPVRHGGLQLLLLAWQAHRILMRAFPERPAHPCRQTNGGIAVLIAHAIGHCQGLAPSLMAILS